MTLSFTASPLDFSGLERPNRDWLQAQRDHKDAQILLFQGLDLIEAQPQTPLVTAMRYIALDDLDSLGPIYLGQVAGIPWFGASLAQPHSEKPAWNFRAATMALPHDIAAIAGRARALLAWHGRRQFCSSCGGHNHPKDGGLRLQCGSCEMEHFPRIDPCVIMLVHCGERCLLGRQANWPDGAYTTLAGFMEPGETIEEACAREVYEESNQRVIKTEYIASQPWPFPSSLMIGLLAEITPDQEVIARDDLEDARWFDRESLRALLVGPLKAMAPYHYSISRLLLKTWLDRAL